MNLAWVPQVEFHLSMNDSGALLPLRILLNGTYSNLENIGGLGSVQDLAKAIPGPSHPSDDTTTNPYLLLLINGSNNFSGNIPPQTSQEIDALLAGKLGPKQKELYKVIPVTLIYCIIFVTGIIGNVSTCIVIARNKYMQTATNYYLFNLAIADLLVLIAGLPLETYSFWSAYPWIFGEPFCVIRTAVAETSTYASILTITAFTVERYIAICHPMKAQTMSSLQRATKAIIIIWVVSAISSTPMVVQFGLVYLRDDLGNPISQSATCAVVAERQLKHAFEISTFLFFLAPMTIITVLYALIGLAIKRSTLSRAGSDASAQSGQTGSELRAVQQARARRAVLKMLVAVVLAFFICWAPFHLQRLMVIYMDADDWTPVMNTVQNVLYYTSGILYFVSCTINPILYNIMSLKFRQAFKNTIFRPCKKRKNKQRKYTTYKFYRRPNNDTNLTLVHGQSPMGHFARLRRGFPSPNCVPIPKKENSSSGGGSGARMIHDEVVDAIEMDHIIAETKSFSSYHSPRTCSVNENYRPYHSFA